MQANFKLFKIHVERSFDIAGKKKQQSNSFLIYYFKFFFHFFLPKTVNFVQPEYIDKIITTAAVILYIPENS